MNRVEIESLIKSFLLFFISISLLTTTIFYLQFKDDVSLVKTAIFRDMKICSFDLKCENFDIKFIDKNNKSLYTLHEKDDTLYSFFPITSSDQFIMKFTLSKNKYIKKKDAIIKKYIIKYIIISVFVLFLSLGFSFYALNPLRESLQLTEEFIKDILHDFNTPISVLRLNARMLKLEIDENKKVKRIEQSIDKILSLQSNLKSYLENNIIQSEIFNLKSVIDERVDFISKIFPNINFIIDIDNSKVKYNKDAFIRILDNLIINASKYNKKDGWVKITNQNNLLIIEDSGIGIKKIKKIFSRFYKENDRGIGIGLHIVKKLCDELKITIKVSSIINKGTIFTLKLTLN